MYQSTLSHLITLHRLSHLRRGTPGGLGPVWPSMPKDVPKKRAHGLTGSSTPYKIGAAHTRHASSGPSDAAAAATGDGRHRHVGVNLHHSLGQHLLKNPLVTAAMIEKASVNMTDVVLEIGPGTGNLTLKLLECCKRVVAIEHDPRMVVELQKRVHGTELAHKLLLIHADFMQVEVRPLTFSHFLTIILTRPLFQLGLVCRPSSPSSTFASPTSLTRSPRRSSSNSSLIRVASGALFRILY